MTKMGQIEYSLRGKAPYIVMVHGTPGGHDAIEAISDIYADQGFGLICPSRSGYMRSPMVYGRNAAENADLIAALLDELEIKEVAVLTISGGGPVGINFAARHPDKCKALLTTCSVTGSWTHPKAEALSNPLIEMALTSTTVARLL